MIFSYFLKITSEVTGRESWTLRNVASVITQREESEILLRKICGVSGRRGLTCGADFCVVAQFARPISELSQGSLSSRNTRERVHRGPSRQGGGWRNRARVCLAPDVSHRARRPKFGDRRDLWWDVTSPHLHFLYASSLVKNHYDGLMGAAVRPGLSACQAPCQAILRGDLSPVGSPFLG